MIVDIEKKLKSHSSHLIIEERELRDIVVGVPHHAPAGVKFLPCPEHRESDENAGHLGRYIAAGLNCCSIIACNYKVDSNKSLRSGYSKQIIKWNPSILVEIHGHGGTKAKSDIEISSGKSKNNKYSVRLEKLLKHKCSKNEKLRNLSICGNLSKIYFKATNSLTIIDDRWISFHIELPSQLRKPENAKKGNPPSLGFEFCDYLIDSLKELCKEYELLTKIVSFEELLMSQVVQQEALTRLLMEKGIFRSFSF